MRSPRLLEWFTRILGVRSLQEVDHRSDRREAEFWALEKELELYRRPPPRPPSIRMEDGPGR